MLELSPELKKEVERRAHQIEIIFYKLSRADRRELRASLADFHELVSRHEWWDEIQADSIYIEYHNEMYKGVGR